jgi:hypothetical protein
MNDESYLAESHRIDERSAQAFVWCELARRVLPWIATAAFVALIVYAFTAAFGGVR